MIPGSNLFRQAIRLIAPMEIQYLKFLGRTQNQVRVWVSNYAPAVPIWASVQAVQRSSYNALGLDFQKNYIKIFADVDVVDLQRDSAGDQYIYNSKIYQIEDQTSWFVMDGWASVMAVEVKPAP